VQLSLFAKVVLLCYACLVYYEIPGEKDCAFSECFRHSLPLFTDQNTVCYFGLGFLFESACFEIFETGLLLRLTDCSSQVLRSRYKRTFSFKVLSTFGLMFKKLLGKMQASPAGLCVVID
jgi:hypothetical protein